MIMRANLNGGFASVDPVVSLDQIIKAREAVKEVYMDEKIEKYILDIIFATNYPEKYNLADLKPLISLELLHVEILVWLRLLNATLLFREEVM